MPLRHSLSESLLVRMPRCLPCCSSETESRSAEEKAKTGKESVGSDEGNNWGMDDSIDVNAVRLCDISPLPQRIYVAVPYLCNATQKEVNVTMTSLATNKL